MKKNKLFNMTAKELRLWRSKRGLEQKELALKLGISVGCIRDYEQGRFRVHPLMRRALRDLARDLGEVDL